MAYPSPSRIGVRFSGSNGPGRVCHVIKTGIAAQPLASGHTRVDPLVLGPWSSPTLLLAVRVDSCARVTGYNLPPSRVFLYCAHFALSHSSVNLLSGIVVRPCVSLWDTILSSSISLILIPSSISLIFIPSRIPSLIPSLVAALHLDPFVPPAC